MRRPEAPSELSDQTTRFMVLALRFSLKVSGYLVRLIALRQLAGRQGTGATATGHSGHFHALVLAERPKVQTLLARIFSPVSTSTASDMSRDMLVCVFNRSASQGS